MIYYIDTPLTDENKDGVIDLGKANAKLFGGAKRLWSRNLVPYGPNAGKHAYATVEGENLPPEDVVEPAPPISGELEILRGEVSRLSLAVANLTAENDALKAKLAECAPPEPQPSKQRHGPSLSNSQSGYYENVPKRVAPYIFDGGARALRIPIKRKVLFQDGEIKDAIMLNGYSTKQFPALKAIIDFCIAENVAAVIDDHSYNNYGHETLLPFWIALGQKLTGLYGDNDLIVLELQNETSAGGWDDNYATNLRDLIHGIRAAGITYPLIAGWGGWNSVNGHKRALDEIDAIGGVEALDPLGKLAFSCHDYPTISGNDQPASGKSKPQIKGKELDAHWRVIFEEFKRRGLKLWVTEIGMGGGARGWLSNGSDAPDFNGRAWFEAFTALVREYPDTVAGVLSWGGGDAWKTDYPFKDQYEKDNWPATKATEYWRYLSGFWKGT